MFLSCQTRNKKICGLLFIQKKNKTFITRLEKLIKTNNIKAQSTEVALYILTKKMLGKKLI